jgi:hypothetical protein
MAEQFEIGDLVENDMGERGVIVGIGVGKRPDTLYLLTDGCQKLETFYFHWTKIGHFEQMKDILVSLRG